MLGALAPAEIQALLHEGVVGRIGCRAEGRTHVVPIVDAYDGVAVYGHSRDGLKLRLMRASRRVCFEVERVADLSNRASVIAWGTFEALHGDAAGAAMARLVAHVAPAMTGQGSARPPENALGKSASGAPAHAPAHAHGGSATAILYRIVLDERMGRFERTP